MVVEQEQETLIMLVPMVVMVDQLNTEVVICTEDPVEIVEAEADMEVITLEAETGLPKEVLLVVKIVLSWTTVFSFRVYL